MLVGTDFVEVLGASRSQAGFSAGRVGLRVRTLARTDDELVDPAHDDAPSDPGKIVESDVNFRPDEVNGKGVAGAADQGTVGPGARSRV